MRCKCEHHPESLVGCDSHVSPWCSCGGAPPCRNVNVGRERNVNDCFAMTLSRYAGWRRCGHIQRVIGQWVEWDLSLVKKGTPPAIVTSRNRWGYPPGEPRCLPSGGHKSCRAVGLPKSPMGNVKGSSGRLRWSLTSVPATCAKAPLSWDLFCRVVDGEYRVHGASLAKRILGRQGVFLSAVFRAAFCAMFLSSFCSCSCSLFSSCYRCESSLIDQ
jgi:hypothetical protein